MSATQDKQLIQGYYVIKRIPPVIISCVISVCIIVTTAVSASCQRSQIAQTDDPASIPRYNLNPDVSEKIVASDYAPWDRMIPQTLDGALGGGSACVIIGEVGDSTVTTTGLTAASGFAFKMAHTIADVKVIETIAGSPPSSDIISYRQIGSPEVPWQTQVKKGDTCILILYYLEDIDQYMTTAQEESIWYVDGKNKLTSMSDKLFAAKYDGIDLSVLVEDIHEALIRIANLNNN